MANYYYVKNGGTATGATVDATSTNGISNTLLTGAWSTTATEYFNDIRAVLDTATVPPVLGDFLIVSHIHVYDNAASFLTYSNGGQIVISVDDTNRSSYLFGAKEKTTSSIAFSAKDNFVSSYIGLRFEANGLVLTGTVGGTRVFTNCELYQSTSGGQDVLTATSDGQTAIYNNCLLSFGGAGSRIRPQYDSKFIFNNCYGEVGRKVTSLVRGSSHNGRCYIEFNSCDLDSIMIDSLIGIDVLTNTSFSDGVSVVVNRCKLPNWASGWSITTPLIASYDVAINQCSNPDTPDHDAYYYNEYHDPFGDVYTDIIKYKTATYDGTNGFSYLMTASARASIGTPLRYKLTTLPAEDLDAGAITYEVEFTSDATLDKTEFWIEIEHADAVDNALGVFNYTNRDTNLLSGGGAHTSSSGFIGARANSYKTSVTIAQQFSATNANVTIYLNLAKATSINVDPAVVIS